MAQELNISNLIDISMLRSNLLPTLLRIPNFVVDMWFKLLKEVEFKTSRSGGPGGQHVNKVESRVELLFDIVNSQLLETNEKEIILKKLNNKISKEGRFRMICDESRSQLKNKETLSQRFVQLISFTLEPVKERIKTKPKRSSREKRLRDKKKLSEKKDWRKPPGKNDA